MKHWITRGFLFCIVGAASFAVAQNPFVGTWKLNMAKSHLTGSTIKFTQIGSMMQETVPEGSFKFKTDGQSYPSLFGETESWKKLGGDSWQATVHGTGGYIYTADWAVSPGGKTLTVNSSGTNPDGTPFHDSTVYTRVGGRYGLLGTWRSTKVKMSSDRTLEFAPNGDDGITWNLPTIKATLVAKFDGKEYAPEGPTVPKGLTLALTKTGARSFRAVEKINGKPLYRGKYTVSQSGKTLTVVGSPVGQSEPETSVYEKQ